MQEQELEREQRRDYMCVCACVRSPDCFHQLFNVPEITEPNGDTSRLITEAPGESLKVSSAVGATL